MALKKLLAETTPLDRFIIVAMLILAMILFVQIGGRDARESLQVKRDGRLIYRGHLSGSETVELNGPLGVTLLEIAAGKAKIISSPCRYKVCIGMGAIDRNGEMIACVPNRLLVTVSGKDQPEENGYDLLSR